MEGGTTPEQPVGTEPSDIAPAGNTPVQESGQTEFEQRDNQEREIASSELEQRVTNLFEQLPKLFAPEIIDEIRQTDNLLRRSGLNPEGRQDRLRSLAEGIIAYKSGYERVEGEVEGAWTVAEEKSFRQQFVYEGLLPREFANMPLREVIPRSIGETVGEALAVSNDMTKPMRKINEKLWRFNVKMWRRNAQLARETMGNIKQIGRNLIGSPEDKTPPQQPRS